MAWRFYSDYPARRTRQIVFDLAAAGVLAVAIVIAVVVHGAISTLAGFGEQIEQAGASFAGTMTDAAEGVAGWPFGEAIGGPFTSAADAGAQLEAAGVAQQEAVAAGAGWAAALIIVMTLLAIAVVWIPIRGRFARRAGLAAAVAATGEGTQLLALRAMVALPPEQLLREVPTAADGWRNRDASTIVALRDAWLRRVGVRPDRLPAPASSTVPVVDRR